MDVYYVVWIKPSGEVVSDSWPFSDPVEAILQAFKIQAISGVVCDFEIRRDQPGLAGSGPVKLAA